MAITFVGGAILAGLLNPSVRWTVDGLDALGSALFTGVVIGGLLGLVFLWPVWDATTHRIQRVGIGLFAISLAMMVGVNALELVLARLPPAAELLGFGFLVGVPLALLVHGIGDVSADRRRRGFVTLGLWIAYMLGWVYGFQTRSVPVLLGVAWLVLISGWALVQYHSLTR